ncbi:MAG: fibronectin type III domain-containing protein [Planctomycetota bacterium]
MRAGLGWLSVSLLAACSSGIPVQPPAVSAVVLAIDVPPNPSGDVALRVTVADVEVLPVDVVLEVSFDAGRTWRAGRPAAGAVTTGLSTSAAGIRHEVLWDSLADAGFRPVAGAQLRVVPTRGGIRGTGLAIAMPVLDNLPLAARRVDHYFIDYGPLSPSTLALAQTFQLAIVHPFTGNVTRAQIQDLQDGVDPSDPADDVLVLAYISIGEDLRTVGVSDAQMLGEARFVGDGSGPRVDPRGPDADGQSLVGIDPRGTASNGGGGYASWYLDDNSVDRSPTHTGDGLPDRNSIFGGCFVNAGDPAWFDALDAMQMDGVDRVPGMRELLTSTYGRGLGCDGLFLDTVDTCAPNFYTDASSPNQSEFEWTAPGFRDFMQRLRATYSTALVLQNRGLFFYDPRLPHYAVNPRSYVDYLKFESYRLNSNTFEEFNPYFFADNKFNFTPKIMAEANRPDGFRVLSLGYAEGPSGNMDRRTLIGQSTLGRASLLEDIREAQDLAGFRHFLTDGAVQYPNTFVRDNSSFVDTAPPAWTSTYNANVFAWPTPPQAPDPRVGVQEVAAGADSATVRWDVALDLNRVHYALYYQPAPFDFVADPDLAAATRLVPEPAVGDGYLGGGPTSYANQARVDGLQPGTTYFFCVRAFDEAGNEEKNQTVLSATPQRRTTITIDGAFDDWSSVVLAHTDPADVPDSSGPDWQSIWVTNDDTNLYVRFTSENAFNLDGSPNFGYSRTLVFIDTDDDPSTGYAVSGSVGSELLVAGDSLYVQSAGNFNGGLLQPLSVAPRFSVTDCEFAVPLAQIRAQTANASRLRLLFVNDEVNDYAPDSGHVAFTLLTQ